jgi:DNA-binding Xre family transcriptional regulator
MIRIALLDALKRRNKSLYWLEQATGVDYSTLHRMATKPIRRVDLPVLDKICAALKCEPGELLVRTEGGRQE